MEPSTGSSDQLIRSILEESKDLGFLGPGPIEDHMAHSLAFIPWASDCSRIMDLGSGGGVPGLVLAHTLSISSKLTGKRLTLLDASQRRSEFLARAVSTMGLSDEVEVVHGRAEERARRSEMRHQFDCVVARSFGAPAVVAECAVGFMKQGAKLVVSEPPHDRGTRWDPEGLQLLGMAASGRVEHRGFGLQVISTVSLCDDKYPRRNGIPAKRPLF